MKPLSLPFSCAASAGAHLASSMGYNYNGAFYALRKILLREDGQAQMIRRAETPEDYFATLLWL